MQPMKHTRKLDKTARLEYAYRKTHRPGTPARFTRHIPRHMPTLKEYKQ